MTAPQIDWAAVQARLAPHIEPGGALAACTLCLRKDRLDVPYRLDVTLTRGDRLLATAEYSTGRNGRKPKVTVAIFGVFRVEPGDTRTLTVLQPERVAATLLELAIIAKARIEADQERKRAETALLIAATQRLRESHPEHLDRIALDARGDRVTVSIMGRSLVCWPDEISEVASALLAFNEVASRVGQYRPQGR